MSPATATKVAAEIRLTPGTLIILAAVESRLRGNHERFVLASAKHG